MRLPDSSRRLVVDTNVARSASESQHPISDACRQVLKTIIAKQHQVVLTATQEAEWQKHKSPFTRGWLVQMASKKLWYPIKPEPDSGLTDLVYALECTPNVRKDLLKDVHLLENALATDEVVLSQETNVLGLFCKHAHALQIPRRVAWVNPVADIAACVAWLEAGAVVATASQVVPAAAEVVVVRLLFRPGLGDDVRNAPLHPSQQVLRETREGLEVALWSQLDLALEALVRRFGNAVEVLEPVELEARVKAR